MRVVHAVDQRQLVGQVGDHRGGVRQPVQRGEGRAALEVDEDEVERLGRVRERPAPSTSVRSSSDLPEPVAPISRPCGPMPSCADSLRSSSTGCAVGADADRHPQPVAVRPGRPGRRPASKVSGSPSPAGRQAEVGRGASAARRRRPAAAAPAAGRAPRRRARSSRSAMPTAAARPSWPSRSAAGSAARLKHHAWRGRAAAAACRRGRARSRRRGRRRSKVASNRPGRPPSMTTTTCGRRWPGRPGPLPDVASTSSSSASGVGDQPDRAERVGPRPGGSACGSHLTHSQSAAPLRDRRRPRPPGRPGRGRWRAAPAWRGPAPGPLERSGRTCTRAKPRSDSATGRSGTTEYASRKRRSAPARHRLEVLERLGLRRDQRRRQRLRADADPDHARSRGRRAPLPQPVAADRRPERSGSGCR